MLKPEDFDDLVGQTLSMRCEPGPALEFELIEVKTYPELDLSRGEATARPVAFSLVFRLAKELTLSQGTYRVDFPQRALDLFLVPIGPFPGETRLEAIFA